MREIEIRITYQKFDLTHPIDKRFNKRFNFVNYSRGNVRHTSHPAQY